MRRSEKGERIGRILDGLYPDPPIPLDHKDAFTLLVAVVLSAQCTDRRVNLVTPGLFALADTPEAMAALGPGPILEAIRSCGLAPTKAKNLWKCSRALIDRFGGEVPSELASLESLPGVGHKTASVVASQWFGTNAFPVDTHIHRCAGRWGLSKARNVAETERDLKKVFPEESWNRRHLQIIFFGREHCPARAHDLVSCVICSWAATKKRIAEEGGP